MAKFFIDEVFIMGLDADYAHVSTDWQVYETINSDDVVGKPIIINDADTENLTTWQNTFYKEGGGEYTISDRFTARVRVNYSNGVTTVSSGWYVFPQCGNKCGFVYTLDEGDGGAAFCISDCNRASFIYDMPASFMDCLK